MKCCRLRIVKEKRSTEGCSKLKSPQNKTSSGEIGLDIRKHASPKVGQDQVSGGVSVLCWHAAPVANVLWKPCTVRLKVKFGNKVQISNDQKLVYCPFNGWCHCILSSSRMSCNIRERGTSYCLVRSSYQP